jgi:hypothetical protein
MSEAIGYLIEKDPNSPTGAKFSWIGVSDLTASRILSGTSTDDEKAARQAAFDFLKDALSDGERLADDIKAEAKTMGLSERTLRRASVDAGMTWRREGFGKDAIYYWDLKKPSGNGLNGFHADHT